MHLLVIIGDDMKLRQAMINILGNAVKLPDDELRYLEEPYVAHPLAGVMAQNKKK